jgi:hypothetical protein
MYSARAQRGLGLLRHRRLAVCAKIQPRHSPMREGANRPKYRPLYRLAGEIFSGYRANFRPLGERECLPMIHRFSLYATSASQQVPAARFALHELRDLVQLGHRRAR